LTSQNCQLLRKEVVQFYTHTHSHTHTHTNTHTHTHTHTLTHTHTHTHTHTQTHSHTQTHTHSHTHTHTHTNTHTLFSLHLSYAKLPDIRKSTDLFHSSQASPACPDESSIEIKMSMQHWCKNTNREIQISGRKISPSAT
jgi:hypothetical protein